MLSEQVLNSKSGIGQAQFSPAQGFGYDFAVVLDPDAAKRQVGKNSYWWWGIAGTWFWIDPTNDLIGIGIIQRMGGSARRRQSRRSVAQGRLRSIGAGTLRRPKKGRPPPGWRPPNGGPQVDAYGVHCTCTKIVWVFMVFGKITVTSCGPDSGCRMLSTYTIPTLHPG